MTNRVWTVAALVAAAIGGIAERAAADVVLDFDTLSSTAISQYSQAGAKITSVGGGQFAGLLSPNGTVGLFELSRPRQELRVDFVGIWADALSVDLGDFGGDADTLFLEAFDTWGRSVGFTSSLLPAGESGMRTLT